MRSGYRSGPKTGRRERLGAGLWAGRSGLGLVFLLTSMLFLAPEAKAGEFRSGFGFGISVPDVWLVLTRGEVEQHSELFLDGGGVDALERIPDSMRQSVFDRIRAGELEIFYRRESESELFVDNVNFLLQPAALPATHEQLAGVCRVLPGEFSRIFGRPISMEACELRDRARGPALYLQFEGAVPGTTTMQYQLPRGRGATLVITATTARASLPRMLSELEGMVESIRIY